MACEVISATSAADQDCIVAISDEKYKITVCSDYSISGKNSLGYAVAENTLKLFVIPKKTFYLIENGSKITYFGTEDYVIKSKGSQGNKTTKDVNIIW